MRPDSNSRMATGRLWDEHLRHLGYPPKFYRVQDAISGDNFRFRCHARVMFIKNHQNLCFGPKVTFKNKNKKAPARKPANSRPEWGCTTDGRLFKVGELANSKLWKSKSIKIQWLRFIHKVKKASMIDWLRKDTNFSAFERPMRFHLST